MTVSEAIQLAGAEHSDGFTQALKLLWLSELEGRIKNEILDTHEGFEDAVFSGGYTSSDLNRTLLAPPPYDRIYVYWLFSRADYANGETARFNASAMLFNTAWVNLANYVNRKYAPKTKASVGGV